jgi:hypothetical protein
MSGPYPVAGGSGTYWGSVTTATAPSGTEGWYAVACHRELPPDPNGVASVARANVADDHGHHHRGNASSGGQAAA